MSKYTDAVIIPGSMASLDLWRNACLQRDGYTCQRCGVVQDRHNGIYICVHHKADKGKYPELSRVVENGISLCRLCHDFAHCPAGRDMSLSWEKSVLLMFDTQYRDSTNGGGRLPIGYTRDAKGNIIVDTDTAPLVVRGFETFIETNSLINVASELGGKTSPYAARYILSNTAYRGSIKGVDGVQIPTFVPQYLLDKATLLLNYRKRNGITRSAKSNLFFGMLSCPLCNSNLILTKCKSQPYFRCKGAKSGTCGWSKYVSVATIEKCLSNIGIDTSSRISVIERVEKIIPSEYTLSEMMVIFNDGTSIVASENKNICLFGLPDKSEACCT